MSHTASSIKAAEDTGILLYRLKRSAGGAIKTGRIKHNKKRYKWVCEFPPPAQGAQPAELDFLAGKNFDFGEVDRKFVHRGIFHQNDCVLVRRKVEGAASGRAVYLARKLLGPSGDIYIRARLKQHQSVRTTLEWVPLSDPSRPFPEELDDLVEAPAHIRHIEGDEHDVLLVRNLTYDIDKWLAAQGRGNEGEEIVLPDLADDDKVVTRIDDMVAQFAYTKITSDRIDELEPYDYTWIVCKTEEDKPPTEIRSEAATRLRRRIKSLKLDELECDLAKFDERVEHCVEKIQKLSKQYLKEKPDSRVKVLKRMKALADQLVGLTIPSPTPGTTTPLGTLGTIADVVEHTSMSAHTGWLATAPEGVASAVAMVQNIHKLSSGEEAANRELVLDILDQGAKLTMSGLKMGQIVITLHEIANKVELGLPGLGYAASGIGIATGTAATVRSSMKFARANRANDKLLALRMIMEDAGKIPTDDSLPPKIALILDYAYGKTIRRSGEHYATATLGVFGVAGSSFLLTAAIVGGANIWNPIGWSIAVVALVAGVALVSLQLYNRSQKNKRREKRIANGMPLSPEDCARKLFAILQNKDEEVEDRWFAFGILRCFGVRLEWFEDKDQLNDYNEGKLSISPATAVLSDLYATYNGALQRRTDGKSDPSTGAGPTSSSDLDRSAGGGSAPAGPDSSQTGAKPSGAVPQGGASDDEDSEGYEELEDEDVTMDDPEDDRVVSADGYRDPLKADKNNTPTKGNAVIYDKYSRQFIWTQRAKRRAMKKLKRAMS